MRKKKNFALVYELKDNGTAQKLAIDKLSELIEDKKQIWVHLNLSDPRSQRWIKKQPEFNDWVKENLVDPEIIDTKLRVKQNKLLLGLRTVNITPRSEPDDLVFLRLYATEKFLITTSMKPSIDFTEIDDLFEDEEGPKSIDEVIPVVLENTLDSVLTSIDQIEDQVDDFEEKIITRTPAEGTYQLLSELLRQVIVIRRFMMPEREVLDNLIRHGVKWFHAETERSIKDSLDRVRRIVEDIDLLEKRIRVNQDALSHMEDRQTQRNTYLLSVIAGIFLPLSFLASVFGMNLGGIPLGSDPWGFCIITLLMILIGFIIWGLFKRLKWI